MVGVGTRKNVYISRHPEHQDAIFSLCVCICIRVGCMYEIFWHMLQGVIFGLILMEFCKIVDKIAKWSSIVLKPIGPGDEGGS